MNFDINAAIPAAWNKLWEANLRQRKEDQAFEKKFGKKPYAWQRTYYLTASDVENQVRLFAAADRDGKPWSSAPVAYGNPMIRPPLRISIVGRRRNAKREKDLAFTVIAGSTLRDEPRFVLK